MKELIIFIFIVFFLSVCHGGEFRQINPIPRPGRVEKGSVPRERIRSVPREDIVKAVKEMFSTWNNGNLGKYLSDDFYDKTRLLDNMYEEVPRDARIRLLSVGETQTMGQREEIIPNGKRIISTVSVTADTQIEFNDPQRGFRRLEGRNEYILRVTEEFIEE